MNHMYENAPRPYGVEGVKSLKEGSYHSTTRHAYDYVTVATWEAAL